jgi:hypothetical protein
MARSKETIMRNLILIFILLFLSSCSIQKQVDNIDDTEHLWIGDNGIEFYE